MEENKNPQAETIGEEQLEEVAGGYPGKKNNRSSDCYFEPENPPRHKIENGEVWVKCKSICGLILCNCHGATHCIDKWHIVEHATAGVANGNWIAYPKGERNHGEGRKLIKNLLI